MNDLTQSIKTALDQLPDPILKIAVAVSGGPDSIALAHAVHDYCKNNAYELLLLTVDHNLRLESAVEAGNVHSWCADHMPLAAHHILRWQHDGIDARIQETARSARYELMLNYCCDHDIEALLIAHHQDDQAETFLLRLAAGSGVNGLAAMAPVTQRGPVRLIRPFLDFGKAHLIAYCQENALPYVNDPSNENTDYARVRLRNAVKALEKEGLNNKRLSVTASRVARAVQALDFYAQQFWGAHVEEHEGTLQISAQEFERLPDEIALRIIIMALEHYRSDQNYLPRMEKIESLSHDLKINNHVKPRTLGGCIFARDEKSGKIRIKVE